MPRVIVISVDGLAGFYWSDERARMPTLRSLAARGALARTRDRAHRRIRLYSASLQRSSACCTGRSEKLKSAASSSASRRYGIHEGQTKTSR